METGFSGTSTETATKIVNTYPDIMPYKDALHKRVSAPSYSQDLFEVLEKIFWSQSYELQAFPVKRALC